MYQLQQTIDRIRSVLLSDRYEETPEVRKLAEALGEHSKRLNDRLQRCGEFLRQGRQADAIHEAESEPRLLESIAVMETLTDKERRSWADFCTFLNLPATHWGPPDQTRRLIQSLRTHAVGNVPSTQRDAASKIGVKSATAATAQRRSGIPPALPTKQIGEHPENAEGIQGDRYFAAAIVASGLIVAGVVLALCWPRRPEVPPITVTVASNDDERRNTPPADQIVPAPLPPIDPHRVSPPETPAQPPVAPPPAPMPEEKTKRRMAVSYSKRAKRGSTTEFTFASPFKSEVEIARVRLLVPVDHRGQVHPDFKDLRLGETPEVPKDASEPWLIPLFKKGSSQTGADPYVQFTIPRNIGQTEPFAVELTGPTIDEIPSACLCGCALTLANGDDLLLLFQKTCVQAMGPIPLENEQFTIRPDDSSMQGDLGRLGRPSDLSFSELEVIALPEEHLDLRQSSDEEGFQATLCQLPKTEKSEEITVLLKIVPQWTRDGPSLKASVTAGKQPIKSIIEGRLKLIRRGWHTYLKPSVIEDRIKFCDSWDKLKEVRIEDLRTLMNDVNAIEPEKLPHKMRALGWITEIIALKELIDKIDGSSLVLKSGRITCRLQDFENVGSSQAPTSEIDLILIGDAQPNGDIDYHH